MRLKFKKREWFARIAIICKVLELTLDLSWGYADIEASHEGGSLATRARSIVGFDVSHQRAVAACTHLLFEVNFEGKKKKGDICREEE